MLFFIHKNEIIQHVYKTYDRHRHLGKDTRDMREKGVCFVCVGVYVCLRTIWGFCLKITRGYFFDPHGFLWLKNIYWLFLFLWCGREREMKRVRESELILQRRHEINFSVWCFFLLCCCNLNVVCRRTESNIQVIMDKMVKCC
jgi:hypothetical protein